MRLYKHLEWHFSRSGKRIYLTFDDGPTPVITEKVLDLLDEYNAKATFFCLGRNVERNLHIYNEIIKRGHAVGNHTYSHLKGWKSTLKSYIQDVRLAEMHVKSNLFRPPYGRIRRIQAKYLTKEYRVIMWDVLSHDYNKKIPASLCLRSVLRSTKKGSIVVFHDSEKASRNMLYVLPRMLEYYTDKGYEFCRIE
jgi:peptidoglycan/xylan/chitin deacetylase (PgdA/CDA1 family)